MVRKNLPDGSWIEKVDHLAQSPEENLTDMVAGFFNPENLNNAELMLICTDCVKVADDTCSLVTVAEFVIDELDNIEFATEVYKKAASVITSIGDYCLLAESLIERIHDGEWGLKLLNEAIVKADEEPNTVSYLLIAETLRQSLNDIDKSDKYFKLAYKYAKTSDDLQILTESVLSRI